MGCASTLCVAASAWPIDPCGMLDDSNANPGSQFLIPLTFNAKEQKVLYMRLRGGRNY
jgi:hypothetical protein